MKEWFFLLGAIVSETFATSMLKLSEQFTRPLPAVCTAVGYLLSFYLLSQALRSIPIGIAYGIWGGCRYSAYYDYWSGGLQADSGPAGSYRYNSDYCRNSSYQFLL